MAREVRHLPESEGAEGHLDQRQRRHARQELQRGHLWFYVGCPEFGGEAPGRGRGLQMTRQCGTVFVYLSRPMGKKEKHGLPGRAHPQLCTHDTKPWRCFFPFEQQSQGCGAW